MILDFFLSDSNGKHEPGGRGDEVLTSMLYDFLMANISRFFWAAATAISIHSTGFLVSWYEA